MLHGSCLCGSVRYEISGPLSGALNCHCVTCRKAQGAAFRSRARVKAQDFQWVQGAECVTYFESSPGHYRGFCRICGSPVLSKSGTDTSAYGLPLGVFDEDPGVRPQLHIFVGSKAPWYDITDNLPQFQEYPERAP